MNSLEKLGFKVLLDYTSYNGRREIMYISGDEKIAVSFQSLFENEPFIQINFGGNLLTNDEMLKINTAINEYWNENKNKFKRGE